MKKKNGFTLVELLGVVVIIAVILSIVLISLSKIRDNANDRAWSSIKEEVMTAAKEYMIANGRLKTDCETGVCDVLVSVGTLVKEDYLNKVSDTKGNAVSNCDLVYLSNNFGKINTKYYEKNNISSIIENGNFNKSELKKIDEYINNGCKNVSPDILALSIDHTPAEKCEGDNCPCIGDDCCEGDNCSYTGDDYCEGEDCPCIGDDCNTSDTLNDSTCPEFVYPQNINNNTWYNKDVLIKYNVEFGSSFYQNLYIENKKEEWINKTNNNVLSYKNDTSSEEINLNQNGNIKSIVHICKGDNCKDCSTNNYKIDKILPTVKITGISKNETANNVTFKIEASDSLSKVASKEYSFDKKTWKTYKSGSVTLLSNTGVQKVYARAKDNAGNISKIVEATGKCDKDRVYVEPKELGGIYFTLKFSSYYNSYNTKKYQYAYWNPKKTSDTSNRFNGDVTKICGTTPPKGSLHNTPDGITGKLYMKYQKQYYCLAVRPYRANEISGLNRWTIQYKHAKTSQKVDSSKYNGY